MLSQSADSEAIKETTRWCFHNNVEAAFLLSKQGMLINANESSIDEYSLPKGLFGQEFEKMIKETSTDMLKVPNYKLLNLFATLGHARILLVQSMPKSSTQVQEVNMEAPLWEKFNFIVNQLLDDKSNNI